MPSPVVFALTRAQAETLDAITRPGFNRHTRYTERATLRRRYLVQTIKGRDVLTLPGHVAQELVRLLALHKDGAGQG